MKIQSFGYSLRSSRREVTMLQVEGKSIVRGISIGTLRYLSKEQNSCSIKTVTDTKAEIVRFQSAKERALEELRQLYEHTLHTLGPEEAMIFEAHQLMLEDQDYLEAIEGRIGEESLNAEYAVKYAGEQFAEIFNRMDNEYMRARADDLRDISELLIRMLNHNQEETTEFQENTILLVEELSPSEIMKLDRKHICGIVTKKGSPTSHMAILAGTLQIPTLIHVPLEHLTEYEGKQGVLDGMNGRLYAEPDEALLMEWKERQQAYLFEQQELNQYIDLPDVTADGKQIRLYANIGSVSDVESVLQSNVRGIGLFRSEFLYLEKDTYPTEEEQFDTYKKVVERMGDRPVIIRTMDIGADKKADYFQIDPEENPALGYRAIRICLDRPALFRTQLRAIYRASAYGKVAIMFPMIIDLREIRQIKQQIEQVKQELRDEKKDIGKVTIGIMIETPAAALISDELAKEVDFFSIGTNDLTQYTLAADRQNEKIQDYYRQNHPAVLKLIAMTVENAHKNGIWAGICGGIAADETMTEQLIHMGVDELSVPPAAVLTIRKKLHEITL